MIHEECPIHIVDEAAELASQLEVGPIPLDFDPGDLRWREILALIAEDFSNHAELLERLDRVVISAVCELCEDCTVPAGVRCEEDRVDCGERWLAEHELWSAALSTAERAYQRWLARRLIRRGAAEGP